MLTRVRSRGRYGSRSRASTRGTYCGIVKCDSRYVISSKGRLKAPDGTVTRGFYYDGRRWAACRGAGLIDLTTCARLRENEVYLQARVIQAINAIGAGMTSVDFAMEISIQERTSWSYFTRGAQFMDAAELLRTAPHLVSRDLWSVLRSMSRDQHSEMGGKLTELYEVVKEALSSKGEFRTSELQMGQLWLSQVEKVSQVAIVFWPKPCPSAAP